MRDYRCYRRGASAELEPFIYKTIEVQWTRFAATLMRARLRQLTETLGDSFWLVPTLLVVAGIAAAELLIGTEDKLLVTAPRLSTWLYTGGETGARTLLGAIAASTIGVAGTVFSITIATLTLASNQLGPRLLRNFTRDRANQLTLGVFLATFAYALMVLRSVRGAEEGAFVPHLAITGAIVLALVCVSLLIFFVHHVASRINSETVIELVYRDLHTTLLELTTENPSPAPPDASQWNGCTPVTDDRTGFIQQLDEKALADWAQHRAVAVRLRARVGDFVFPGAIIAVTAPAAQDAQEAIRSALALGAYPTASMDMEFAVTQLVDIAVRALSTGINDPNTAIRVLDYLGAALCIIARRHLPTGVAMREGRVVLHRDTTQYDGLVDSMFLIIRQNAGGAPAVLIRMLEVLTKVAECEDSPERRRTIVRHASLILSDGAATIGNQADLSALRGRADNLFALIEGTVRLA